MKLSQLLSIYPHLKWGQTATKDVTSICFDSRQIEKGCVFVAIKGTTQDGHKFLDEAADKGAIAFVVQDEAAIPKDFSGAVVTVPDTREALGNLATRFYDEPGKKMFCVGVTGTNGKTTLTHMIEAILTEFGWPTGVVGTIDHHLGTHVWKTEMTTPDPLSFQRRLHEFVAMGAQAVVLEASSHALKQRRVDQVPFDVAVFTNLTRDHMDYHPDMEDYFQAKNRLFEDLLAQSPKSARFAIVNRDDAYGKRITGGGNVTLWTYGREDADFTFEIHKQDFSGSEFTLKTVRGEHKFRIQMTGLHNVYNATAAIAVGVAAGASLETCAKAMADLPGVNGRLEAISNKKGVHVFVDYAHTDDALRSVLNYLDQIRKTSGLKSRILTVFGCGGDRDKGKRPLMMKAALERSDLVFLTSDNPRTEDPKQILEDALKGADAEQRQERVRVEVDRKKSIFTALKEANKGDVVLIAGKGHETYQQIGTQKFPFSDAEVVREFFG